MSRGRRRLTHRRPVRFVTGASGHEIRPATRRAPPTRPASQALPTYLQADLADPADAYAAACGHDAVIHAAAISEPMRNTPHTVFQNNLKNAGALVLLIAGSSLSSRARRRTGARDRRLDVHAAKIVAAALDAERAMLVTSR